MGAELPEHDRRSVLRNVLVAGAFRPKDIETHPIALLEELALFVKERSGMTERPRALDLPRVAVEVPDGRDTKRVRGDRVTLERVRAARRALGKKKQKLSLTEDHATFSRVPLEQLRALGAVLSDLALPDREGPS